MFKEMARDMSDKEVQRCMDILIDGCVITGIFRDLRDNTIRVSYKMRVDTGDIEYEVILLSDSVVAVTPEIEKNFRHDGEYLYRQYLVAHYYSELWVSNFFAEEYKDL